MRPLLVHAYHQLSCGATGRLIRRHDSLAKIIGQAASTHLNAHFDLKKHLSSSIGGASTKVDLVISLFSTYPPVTAVDITVSCPLVPAYSAAAAHDAAALFATRAREKNIKHLDGCIAQERTFLPVVLSTLGGIGPPESVHYLDSFFSEAYAAERAATGSTRRTNHLRTLFYQSLLTTLTAASADMAAALTHGAAAAAATVAAAAVADDPAAPGDPDDWVAAALAAAAAAPAAAPL